MLRGLNPPGPGELAPWSTRCGSPRSGALTGHFGTKSVAGETQHKTKQAGLGRDRGRGDNGSGLGKDRSFNSREGPGDCATWGRDSVSDALYLAVALGLSSSSFKRRDWQSVAAVQIWPPHLVWCSP